LIANSIVIITIFLKLWTLPGSYVTEAKAIKKAKRGDISEAQEAIFSRKAHSESYVTEAKNELIVPLKYLLKRLAYAEV
jgi:hypothetical protein